MTTFNSGWVLANGQEINWEYTDGLGDSSTVAKINDDKTIGNYVKKSEMEEEKAYYFYSSWQQNGSYIYLKKNGSFYKGFLENGSDKFTKDDIKRKSTDSDSDSENKEINYKTEVERTEKLQVKVQNIFEEVLVNNLDYADGYDKLSKTPALISNIISDKDSEIAKRKRWARGTNLTNMRQINLNNGRWLQETFLVYKIPTLDFIPSIIIFAFVPKEEYRSPYPAVKLNDSNNLFFWTGIIDSGGSYKCVTDISDASWIKERSEQNMVKIESNEIIVYERDRGEAISYFPFEDYNNYWIAIE